MKYLTRGFAKRALSIVLVLMMLMSLCIVGITSSSAASVELAETGASQTFAAGDYIYIKNFKPASSWSAYWFAPDINEWVHLWNDSTGDTFDAMFELIEGTANSADAVYGAKITNGGTFDHVIFTRAGGTASPWDDERNRTGNIVLDGKSNCFTNMTVGGTSFTGSVYTPPIQGGFWVDVDGNPETLTDVIYPENSTLYLPANADLDNLTFYVSEGVNLTVGDATVEATGTVCSVVIGNNTLGGDYAGRTLKVMQSANVSAIYTTTEIEMPTTTGQYEHKDDYSTKGMIMIVSPDGEVRVEEGILDKIKGRGNSSWEASNRLIGKYAFNITLESKIKLLEGGEKSKKYCLVSYNADEARMRNMIVYELSEQIGVEYVAKYEPVDLYNNGYYIGSYLLTDKVEIGDDDEPLVDIVDLDGENEDFYGKDNYGNDDFRGSSSGNLNDNSTKSYIKYYDYTKAGLGTMDPSVYANSGFLLEFELNERFANEMSGFISAKGQQIVSKYPEFASKEQMEFILDKWNTAEALMYDKNATYEQLDAVIDVESFAKMYLIQELTKNLDGGATSYYVYYDGGKLHAGCAWDYDWALGQYARGFSERINTSSDFYNNVDGNPGNYNGWYLNSKNIYGTTNVLNAQAALCQNDNFWNVVTAEWNELFYSEGLEMADSTVGSVNELDGMIAEFYTQVHASTEMDEAKWGLIWKDLLANQNGGGDWGSADTGETHNEAVVALNNWYYNRLAWMNQYLSSESYTLATPTLTADKDSYQVGETVTLTAKSNSSGTLTYNFYDAQGTLIDSVVSDTGSAVYSYQATQQGTAVYSVTVTSENTTSETEAVEAEVLVEGFTLILDVKAPESVTVGDSIIINASTNSDETVTYTLKDSNEKTLATNTTGKFTLVADAEGEYNYHVEATTIVDGEKFSEYKKFTVVVNKFNFSVDLSAPSSVEAGMRINLKAETNSSAAVTYTFYDAKTNNVIANNGTGLYSVDALDSEIGSEKSFYVVATTTIAGQEYTATSETMVVSITEVKETFEVTIYFKSTSTLGYKPLITTTGAVSDLADAEMTKDIFICKNSTQTASYYWYKTELEVSKASPALTVTILSSRYAMEGNINLTITESGSIYLAVDNLNSGYEMLDLTDWTEEKRNWTKSAVHMVYDDAIDGEQSLAALSALVNLTYVGDANGDDKVNVKDVTLIQKHLAGIETLDSTGVEVSDVTDDGYVTIKDATAIQKKLVARL